MTLNHTQAQNREFRDFWYILCPEFTKSEALEAFINNEKTIQTTNQQNTEANLETVQENKI